ncbi:GNAT family N-acetyltransferase [Oleisolibacter albus]|uniref:GNAT family N-acetyltransferase n=1 Tax=Oleisolibacter albus TaxID=2171757 RepID=UPI00138FC2D7|nr:GNAT family N-acetyltransferase [Oleisolibacter albus]
MSPVKAAVALEKQHLDPTELNQLAGLEIEESQIQYFGTPDEVLTDIHGHVGSIAMLLLSRGKPVGYFITRRDLRDAATWWLSWFMLDRREQGKGYGKPAFRLILAWLASRPGCRRIRLQVTPGNDTARTLYVRHGFVETGLEIEGDDVLELDLAEAPVESVPVLAARSGLILVPAAPTGRRAGTPASGAEMMARLGPAAWPPPLESLL